MTEVDIGRISAVGRTALKRAGTYLRNEFGTTGRPTISYKTRKEITIRQDREAEELILETILAAFPSHRILSEEVEEQNPEGEYAWIIDPLDGTTNFSMGVPLFATQLAVADHDGEIVFACIYVPLTNQLYWSNTHDQVFHNKTLVPRSTNLALSTAKTTVFLEPGRRIDSGQEWGAAVTAKLVKHTRAIRKFGCTAHAALAVLTNPDSTILLANGCKLVDYAPAAKLLSSQGLSVVDLSGEKWNIDSLSLVAGHPELVSSLLALLK